MKQRKQTSAKTTSLRGIDVETWQMTSQTFPLSYQTRQELVVRVAPPYQAASRARKNLILDTFVELTGHARKSTIRLLNHPPAGAHVIQRHRLPCLWPGGAAGVISGLKGGGSSAREASGAVAAVADRRGVLPMKR